MFEQLFLGSCLVIVFYVILGNVLYFSYVKSAVVKHGLSNDEADEEAAKQSKKVPQQKKDTEQYVKYLEGQLDKPWFYPILKYNQKISGLLAIVAVVLFMLNYFNQ